MSHIVDKLSPSLSKCIMKCLHFHEDFRGLFSQFLPYSPLNALYPSWAEIFHAFGMSCYN